ncbi:hypothetical protein GCM10022239_18640 [Leifsonia bigeumensis]|uniref:ABC transport system permease protein n=1 Tax=Leifsonella bigeumensis TaxID=433643 RepID=A0ABP7FMZ8_9MICO
MRMISGLVGAVAEAWAELRIHRTRVLLSLVGVAVAVAALTSVVGLGSMVQQATTETYERQSGRPATLYVGVYDEQGEPPAAADVRAAFDQVVDRYRITWAGAVNYAGMTVQFRDGASFVNTIAVDSDYGTMHRIQVTDGYWFTPSDENRLAPALVVNQKFYERIGSPDLRTHPTVTILGEDDAVGVIVGVVPAAEFDDLSMYVLNSAYLRMVSPLVAAQSQPQYELWVPPELSDQLTELIRRDIAGALGEGINVDVSRQDYAAWGGEDPLLPIKLLVTGVAVLVLLLGALGLVNISLVTVRQRIREIGIRRSFGATAGRVFFAVMMESVVASVAAGVVGVLVAILIVENPWVQGMLAEGLMDVPPFPIGAALLGLGAATFVGALAGLLPALVAVRVKVIDAIRY